MPAGSPPGGLDRRFIVSKRIMRNAGADSSVTYQVCAFNPDTGVIFLAGDQGYVGLMTRGIFGEVVQGAVLPGVAVGWTGVSVIRSTGEWLLLNGTPSLRRGPAGLDGAWTVITPPAVVPYGGCVSYNNLLITGSAFSLMFGSLDNGATWPINIDTGGGGIGLTGLRTNPAMNRLICVGTGGAGCNWTAAPDAASGTWSNFPVDNAGVPINDAAISNDGLKAVVVSNNGDIATTADFLTFNIIPIANNPFRSTAAVGSPCVAAVYVAALGGFIITTFAGQSGFIPEDDMTQVYVGNPMFDIVSTITNRNVVSDGIQALWPGVNTAMCTVRNIGQLGKT